MQYPAPIPAKEPPALTRENIRFACLALNISPAKIQNWNMDKIVTISTQTYKTGMKYPDKLV